jgi:hypothetical protein
MSSANRANGSMDCSLPLRNSLHERFAQLMADGFGKTDAYRAVSPNVTPASANTLGSRWFRKVEDRILFLQGQSHTEKTLGRKERRELIAARARDEKVSNGDLVNLLQLDAKLAGELTERAEITTRTPLTPQQISEAMRRSPALAGLSMN